jgi:hypothetical protein
LSKAQIPLTISLLEHAKDPSIPNFNTMHPDDAKAYLTEKLHWRAVDIMGNVIGMDQLPATKVFVLNGIGEHPEDNTQLSNYRDYDHMWEPTHGKAGGASQEDRHLSGVNVQTT